MTERIIKERSELDYMITGNGIEITVESGANENINRDHRQQRDRLMKYYQKLLELKGVESDTVRCKALAHMVENMTEAKAREKADDFEKAQYLRLLAYATALSRLQLNKENSEEAEEIDKEELGKIDKMASALVEVLDAAADDEQELQETVEINGNKFVYTRDSLDIRNHIQQLFEIGERTKGNTWSIYLDDEGELVIY